MCGHLLIYSPLCLLGLDSITNSLNYEESRPCVIPEGLDFLTL